jgi:L-lysine 6-transaminase
MNSANLQQPMEDKGVLDSTWGGCLADMVRFVQEVKIVEREGLIATANAKGARLNAGLKMLERSFPEMLENVRGMGLYQGFSLLDPDVRSALVDLALEKESLLLLPAGERSIRLRPNLSVTEQDIDLLLQMLEHCLGKLRKHGVAG